jgi:DNA modification methylase
MIKTNLLFGSCLEMMKQIPDGSVDLTVTSPPYDNLRSYNGMEAWGPHIWMPVIEGLHRVTKDGGVVVWVVNDATVKGSETGTSFRQALYAMDCGFNLHDTMIYEKAQAFCGSKYAYYTSFEYMFVFSKSRPKSFNPIIDRKNVRGGKTESTAKSGMRKDGTIPDRHKKTASEFGKRKNIWTYGVGGGSSGHPAVFPLKLAQDHIRSWSNEGDIVLDPFMGSGTTGVAAKNLGRDFIGIEIDPEYFAIAERRINESPAKNPS